MAFTAHARFTRRLTAPGLLAAALLAGSAVPTAAASWGRDYVPNHELVAQNGERVRFVDDVLQDKIVVITFMYTDCPDICGLSTARLSKIYEWLDDRMGEDIVFASISLTPETDTPETLEAFAEAFGAGEGWYFLTGSREDIDEIRYKLGERSRKLSEHRSDMVIGNMGTGEWRRTSLMGNLVGATEDILELDPDWQRPELPPQPVEEASLKQFESRNRVGHGLFAKACSACHTIGGGVRVGPDLDGVTLRRDREWLEAYIRAPDRLLAEGDPTAVALDDKFPAVRMPNFGLGATDVADLIEYFEITTRESDGNGFASVDDSGDNHDIVRDRHVQSDDPHH